MPSFGHISAQPGLRKMSNRIPPVSGRDQHLTRSPITAIIILLETHSEGQDMADLDIENVCEELCRDCIVRFVPEEAPFFDAVWQAVHTRMFPNDRVLPPEEWRLSPKSSGTAGALGLHGVHEDMATISIVSTLCAVVIETLSSGSSSRESLDSLLSKYGEAFGTPVWAVPHIRSLVEGRIHHPSQRLRRQKTTTISGKPYLIWTSAGRPGEGTEDDVDKCREEALDGRFDIFANAARRVELLVLGRPSRLNTGETLTWAMLTLLLQRVGSLWTHEELFHKIKPGQPYKQKKSSPEIYQIVRHVKEVLAADIEASGVGIPAGVVDSWFVTKHMRCVEVGPDLRACLILRKLTTDTPA